jgi:hypothetical protein
MWLAFDDRLIVTTHFDQEMRILADRHYSRRTVGARQFLYSGRKLVIRNAEGTMLFGWVWCNEELRLDRQKGYNCAIFRNESDRRSSDIILECEALAYAKWGLNRVFTYVDPGKIRSKNPGCCFKKAGWKRIGTSQGGLHLLAKEVARATR